MKKDIGAKTLLFPTPVLVVATYDKDGKPNAMTAAWGGICCSDPPCVTVSLRKATYTYGSLMENKAYTINIPGVQYAREADYFGIASARDEDKFAVTGLTPVRSEFVNAPYIDEFLINLECKVLHVADLGLHTQFVGEVVNAKLDSSLSEDQPLIEQIRPLIFAPGGGNYYSVGDAVGKAFKIGKQLKRKDK
jgi:flavin reductase (DIM6/NTAB) family NADH-FMN oxidoreductase RutF